MKTTKLIRKKSQVTAAIGAIIDSLDGSSTKDAPSIRAVNEGLENKADKIAVLNESGEEVLKKIDLGFKTLEEKGNITKVQLIDRDTKGIFYPETTWERIIDKPESITTGELDEICEGALTLKVSPNMGIKIEESEKQ